MAGFPLRLTVSPFGGSGSRGEIEHADKPSLGYLGLDLILRHVGKPKAAADRVHPQGDFVEHQLPLDPHLQARASRIPRVSLRGSYPRQ